MADNFIPDTDSDATYAADEIAGVKHARVKLQYGADGSATDVSDSGAQLPVGGSGATALGKAIDAVAGASDVGVPALAMRDDVLASLSPAEGDWVPLRIDSLGHLWVKLGSNDGTVIGDVNVIEMPADDRTTDSISAAVAIDKLMNDQTEITPSYAVIDSAASGDTTLVTATACTGGMSGSSRPFAAAGGLMPRVTLASRLIAATTRSPSFSLNRRWIGSPYPVDAGTSMMRAV